MKEQQKKSWTNEISVFVEGKCRIVMLKVKNPHDQGLLLSVQENPNMKIVSPPGFFVDWYLCGKPKF